MGTHPIFESDFDCLTECHIPVVQISTQPTKAEGKAQDVAKVSDPSPASAPVKSTRNGKAPFCVDNQLVESKQDMELETRIKVRTRVEFKEVQINADCVCVEPK